MRRITRFAANAGCRGTVMTAILAAFVLYLIVSRPAKGDWPILVSAALVFFFGAYALRNILVAHLETSRRIMTVAVIAGAIASVALRKSSPELGDSMAVTLALGAFLGLYMGCYFWLLSDPRIGRVEE